MSLKSLRYTGTGEIKLNEIQRENIAKVRDAMLLELSTNASILQLHLQERGCKLTLPTIYKYIAIIQGIAARTYDDMTIRGGYEAIARKQLQILDEQIRDTEQRIKDLADGEDPTALKASLLKYLERMQIVVDDMILYPGYMARKHNNIPTVTVNIDNRKEQQVQDTAGERPKAPEGYISVE